MKKILFASLLLLSLGACSELEDYLGELSEGKLINIQIGATEATTRVSYEPSSDGSIYTFSWNIDDEVSVIVPSTDNANQKFTALTAGSSTQLDGKIATWSGEQMLYAIYPYSASGYTVDSLTHTIFYDNSAQTIDATSGNVYTGFMVASAPNSTAVSESEYSISDLSFKQVLSYFELELTDIPDGERCTTIGFEAGSDSFVASADINLSTGVTTPRTYSSSVSAVVENQSGSEASLNFALLPVDMSGTAITLYITTINDTDSKKYTYQIESGVNFESNTFLYSGSGALSLTDDFTESGAGVLYLADFDSGIIPEGDTWVIADVEATTASFAGLKSVLASIYSADNTRRISIELPYLNAIPNNAFSDASSSTSSTYYSSTYNALSSISAPAALSIGERAFFSCGSLSNVNIPLVTSIETYAFGTCISLSSIEFPSIISIGTYAFSYCKALLSVKFIKATSIGNYAFQKCTTLSSVEFPSVTLIGDSAFYGCTTLSSVEFPLVTSIGSSAFYDCTTLSSVKFPEAISINAWAFRECAALSIVEFPSATSIGTYAFYSCTTLSSVEFPLVTSIGSYAFEYCRALSNIEFPIATSIEYYAFRGCSVLSNVECPLVTSIGSCAFEYCIALSSIEFPITTSIGAYAFRGCTVLSSIELPMATSIGGSAFYGCTTLSSIELPAATSIDGSAFYGCISLSDVEFPAVTSIGDTAFYGCDALRTMALATNDNVVLLSMGTDVFAINDTTTSSGNITLTLGLSNSDNVVDNTLTVKEGVSYSSTYISYTFNKIILSGGSQSYIAASGSNGVGKAW